MGVLDVFNEYFVILCRKASVVECLSPDFSAFEGFLWHFLVLNLVIAWKNPMGCSMIPRYRVCVCVCVFVCGIRRIRARITQWRLGGLVDSTRFQHSKIMDSLFQTIYTLHAKNGDGRHTPSWGAWGRLSSLLEASCSVLELS